MRAFSAVLRTGGAPYAGRSAKVQIPKTGGFSYVGGVQE